MYLTFEEYKQLGGTYDEEQFAAYEPQAEVLLDNWTLNRLRNEDVQKDVAWLGYDKHVKAVMVKLVQDWPAIQKARETRASGGEVTSFSNGVNSFSFGAGSSGRATDAEDMAYYEACQLLPVDLISAAVGFNHAS